MESMTMAGKTVVPKERRMVLASSPLQDIKDTYAGILHLRDDDKMIVDFAVSMYTAVVHPQLVESLYGYLIGPASSGKTEILRIFYDWHKCIGVDEPTPASLQSGYVSDTGEDMSLFPKLDGKLFFIKDMSTLMQSRPNDAAKIMSLFRGSHDGDTAKSTGTLGVKWYKSRFGLLIATTDVVDSFVKANQQLGERFLSFRVNRTHLNLEQRQGMLDRARGLEVNKELKRTRLRMVAHERFELLGKYCLQCPDLPKIPEAMYRRIAQAGDLLAVLRTCAVQGVGGQPEMGYRVVSQLFNLGHAHAVSDGRDCWNETDVALVMRVIVDTLSKVRSRVLSEMFKRGPQRPAETIEAIAQRARTTPPNIEDIFLQYIHSGVIQCISDDRSAPIYRLSKEYYDAIASCELFEYMSPLPLIRRR